MFSIWLDDTKITFIDLFKYELLKYDFIENERVRKNPYFFYILNNLSKDYDEIFNGIEIIDFIKLHKEILQSSFSPQLEYEFNKKLDILKFLLKSKAISTEEAIPYLIEIKELLLENLGVNPIIVLKFCFILFNLNLEDIKSIFSKLYDIHHYVISKVKKIEEIGELSKSDAINSSIFIISYLVLSRILDKKEIDNFILKNLHKIFKKMFERDYIDYEFLETLSYYFDSLKEFKIDSNILRFNLKLTIQKFFEDFLTKDRFTIDNLLKIWSILINLRITSIRLSLRTLIKIRDTGKEILNFPIDRIIFFEEFEKAKLPTKIIKFIDEMELCFNNECYRACQFFIRLIIETCFYIRANMNNQLDNFKKKDDFLGLKEWPDIAYNLYYITKSQLPQVKDLIKYGDVGIHNPRIPANREELKRNIEKLREIVYNIFFSSNVDI
ncbi:MAG: hypothetical protein ACFFG0_38550 [Candidatus Thorarchaeota archaeon]